MAETTEAVATAARPLVFEQGGLVRANSQDVADHFGKRHTDVLRAIRGLVEAETTLSGRSFASADYIDAQGKPRPSYNMDRDGFMLLAMGFTGPKALKFKMAFIEAFNRMEVALIAARTGQPMLGSPERRAFPDWPLDELRSKKSVVDMYYKCFGGLAAQWLLPQLGFPMPPRDLIELDKQLRFRFDTVATFPAPPDDEDPPSGDQGTEH